jgi:repressor LexA
MTKLRKPLSQRQQDILDVIKKDLKKKGYPPTVQEIADAIDVKSTFGVRKHIEALEKKGYIKREIGLSRAIRVIE